MYRKLKIKFIKLSVTVDKDICMELRPSLLKYVQIKFGVQEEVVINITAPVTTLNHTKYCTSINKPLV